MAMVDIRSRLLCFREDHTFLAQVRTFEGHKNILLPGGGFDWSDKTPFKALLRELDEELYLGDDCDIIITRTDHQAGRAQTFLHDPRPMAVWNDFEKAYFAKNAPALESVNQLSYIWTGWIQCPHPENLIRESEKHKFEGVIWVDKDRYRSWLNTGRDEATGAFVNFDLIDPAVARHYEDCLRYGAEGDHHELQDYNYRSCPDPWDLSQVL